MSVPRPIQRNVSETFGATLAAFDVGSPIGGIVSIFTAVCGIGLI
jgi:hypothetical protein